MLRLNHCTLLASRLAPALMAIAPAAGAQGLWVVLPPPLLLSSVRPAPR